MKKRWRMFLLLLAVHLVKPHVITSAPLPLAPSASSIASVGRR
jgi:hypothetical protein